MKKIKLLTYSALTAVLAVAISFSTQAEVTNQSDHSFTVKHSFVSDSKLSTVRHEFGHVGRWWTSEFTLSGNGHNMFFNGKGLYESMPDGKTITYLTKIDKGVWNGTFGDLKGKDAHGQMTVNIKNYRYGTKISLEYTVNSELLPANKHWPKNINSLLGGQMASLQTSLLSRQSHARVILK